MTADITLELLPLPSTNNAWGFGGAREKMGFNVVGRTFDDYEDWVFGIACQRHTGEFPFLRNRSLEIDRGCKGGAQGAKILIRQYYAKQGKTVSFTDKPDYVLSVEEVLSNMRGK